MEFYTAQYRYSGQDRMDITAKSKEPLGKIFSPTWKIVDAYKYHNMSEEEYSLRYLHEMRISYLKYREKWNEVLNKSLITVVCFCPAGEFCHRLELAKILQTLGAKYNGERKISRIRNT
jgi:uncharacterized protein YeaO (DUF488 family)